MRLFAHQHNVFSTHTVLHALEKGRFTIILQSKSPENAIAVSFVASAFILSITQSKLSGSRSLWDKQPQEANSNVDTEYGSQKLLSSFMTYTSSLNMFAEFTMGKFRVFVSQRSNTSSFIIQQSSKATVSSFVTDLAMEWLVTLQDSTQTHALQIRRWRSPQHRK